MNISGHSTEKNNQQRTFSPFDKANHGGRGRVQCSVQTQWWRSGGSFLPLAKRPELGVLGHCVPRAHHAHPSVDGRGGLEERLTCLRVEDAAHLLPRGEALAGPKTTAYDTGAFEAF